MAKKMPEEEPDRYFPTISREYHLEESHYIQGHWGQKWVRQFRQRPIPVDETDKTAQAVYYPGCQ